MGIEARSLTSNLSTNPDMHLLVAYMKNHNAMAASRRKLEIVF